MLPNFIESESLYIRPVQSNDANAIFAYRSDSETNKYQGWIPKTFDDVTDFISNKVCSTFNLSGSWFQFVLIHKKTEQIIGDIGVHFLVPENNQVEIGCTLSKAFHGNGFASEALRALINLLFNDFNKHRIIASIDPENTNSIKLVERLHFRKEAHFKESIFINNKWVDDIIYAILKKEWPKVIS